MKVYGQIENAQLENKASDYSVGPVGRIWWNTATTKANVDDGTNIRALLRNDGFCVLGNSGTASSNIRLHRGAAGVLQFVSGADVTAEGTLSTSINQISAKMEAYATGSLPATGNAGRLAWDTTTTTIKVDTGASWTTVGPGNAFTSPVDILNYSLTASVSLNALTIALKTAAAADPSSGDPVKISFRNATSATGTFAQVNATAATSVVVSSGSTLGATNGAANWVYVYAINNAGTIELAVSGTRLYDEGSVQTTVAEGGAGAADSKNVLYSTTLRTNVAVRLIGRVKSTQATAGTWATSPSEISLAPLEKIRPRSSVVAFTGANGFGSSSTKIRRFSSSTTLGTAITYAESSTLGSTFTINEDGIYFMAYSDNRSAGSTDMAISLNSTELTTNSSGMSSTDRLAYIKGSATPTHLTVSTVYPLSAGDVIRAHGDGTADDSGGLVGFRITRIA